MSKKRGNSNRKKTSFEDPASENFRVGVEMIKYHPMFYSMTQYTHVRRSKGNRCPEKGWAVVTSNGDIHVHPTRLADPKEWAYVLAHCLLHLGLGHFKETENPLAWNIACDRVVACFLQEFKLGTAPDPMDTRLDSNVRDEEKIYRQLLHDNLTDQLRIYSTAGIYENDMVFEADRLSFSRKKPLDWKALFGIGVANAVAAAVEVAGGAADSLSVYGGSSDRSPAQRAKTWFINHFPLLGAMAASFKIIENPSLCQRLSISVAAVDAEASEIYMNPAAGLDDEEYRFVMAHELLHVALRHQARRQGRDPYLWNVACDYVINDWLIEMQVGSMPALGALYDPALHGLNAEAIYDLIVGDLRRFRKLRTLRGIGEGDMLGEGEWWKKGDGMALDEFYRRTLAQGLQYHEQQGRGLIPAGLIEEILALSQPPLPWDVELAQWFDAQFPPLEKERSYARPSRRQSSTPDIPRPRFILTPQDLQDRTFGVVLDTSGSMDRTLLGKALGAIASYSIAREVQAVRVVFCDAHPYDQGYMPPEEIAGRVKIKGRGGTVLMPGIRLLETAENFPKKGPILIITDTYCDRITVRQPREHAFLIPQGQHLPFPTIGKVFKIE